MRHASDDAGPAGTSPTPGPHLGLTWRTPTPQDVAAVAGLLEREAESRRPLRAATVPEVRRALIDAPAEGEADALVGVDAGGTVRAAATVLVTRGADGRPECFGLGSVDPSWCGRGVGRAVLAWQLSRARRLAGAGGEGASARYLEVVDDLQVGRRRVHAAAGFSPRRSIIVLSRAVDPRLRARDGVAPAAPPGIEVRSPAEGDRAALARLQGELRALRAGEVVHAPDRWTDLAVVAAPDLSAAAFAADGSAVGMLLSARPDDPGLPVPALTFGVLPAWRAHGVGPALLAHVHTVLAAAGARMHLAEVDVASSARAPLQDAGYGVAGTRTVYGIDLPPPSGQGPVAAR